MLSCSYNRCYDHTLHNLLFLMCNYIRMAKYLRIKFYLTCLKLKCTFYNIDNLTSGNSFPYKKFYVNFLNRGMLHKEFNSKNLDLLGTTVKTFRINSS